LYSEHGYRSPVDPFHGKADMLAIPSGRDDVEERQVVIGCRDGKQRIFAEEFIIDQPLFITGFQQQYPNCRKTDSADFEEKRWRRVFAQ